MLIATRQGNALPGTERKTSKSELEYRAYEDKDDSVYKWYKNLPAGDREMFASVYVLNSVIRCGIADLDKSKKAWEPSIDGIIARALAEIELDLERFIQYCSTRNIRPRQLYERMLDWSRQLAERSKPGKHFTSWNGRKS